MEYSAGQEILGTESINMLVTLWNTKSHAFPVEQIHK